MYKFGLITPEDEKKISELDAQLKENPFNIDALLKKGFILHDGAVDDEAIKVFKKIIEIDPQNEKGYVWLVESLWMLGDSNQLKDITERAIKIFPNNGIFHLYLSYALHVLFYADLKVHINNIIWHLRQAITLEPTLISARIFLIECLLEDKKLDLAELEINEAFKHIQENFPAPISEMDLHYETFMTRRYDSENTKVALSNFLKHINEK